MTVTSATSDERSGSSRRLRCLRSLMVCVLPAKGLFLAFCFYVRFLLLFYLVAIWKVPSEWLTAISVNFQCGSSADLLLSLLSLQQVPQEPRWTWAGVFRSSSWQEPRPCLVVNEGRAHSPPRRLQPGGFCRELGQPPCGSPLPRPPRSLRFSQPQPPGGGRGLVLQETWDPAKPRTLTSRRSCFLRHAPAGAGSAWLLTFVLLVFLNRSAQVGLGRSCLLVPLAHSAGLRGPALSSPRSRRPHPGPAILGPCFSLLLL